MIKPGSPNLAKTIQNIAEMDNETLLATYAGKARGRIIFTTGDEQQHLNLLKAEILGRMSKT